MGKNREIIEFIFDFSGLDFTESDYKFRDRMVAQKVYDWDEAVFAIKADKVEHLLNTLREMVEEE